jgi:hypothetical protein
VTKSRTPHHSSYTGRSSALKPVFVGFVSLQTWENTTGPKTEEGKKRVSRNAYKHGMRSAEVRELERLMLEMNQVEQDARKLVR